MGTEGEEKWRPDRISTPEAGEIRRGRQERQVGGALQEWRSRRGEEGICPTH